MEGKARIVRGGTVVSAYDNEGKQINTPKPVAPIDKGKTVKASTEAYKAYNETDLAGHIKAVSCENLISPHTAASCIVGEIRRIYFSSINRPDSYDIQILNYMDKILFNNLTDIVEGIIRYGSVCFPREMINQTIEDVVNIMETQPNMKAIFYVIDRLYQLW